MFINWRFRAIGFVILAASLWQSRMAHPSTFHGFGGKLTLVVIVLWVAGLFAIRHLALGPWVTVPMLVISGVLVRATPAATAIMLITYLVCGSRLSWHWLRILGVPLVLAGALLLNYPLVGSHLSGLMDSLVTLAVLLLLGRFSRDSEESQAAQAKALADLQQAHAELQRYAAQVEELSALRERSQVARDLHDTLGHALSAITVQLEAVRRVNRRDPGAVDRMLVETQALARQAMQELRQYLAGLRDEGDLVSRLEALARETAARNGWQLSLQLAPADLSDEGRRTLLQIAREALTNIERRAGAGSVAVGLRCEGGRVVLSVADDGRGFEPGAHPSGHFGLQGMAERLAELRGELRVESSPGHGSRVTAMLPGEGS
jgi:signal transduction histidine kinase